MTSENRILATETFVKKCLANEPTGHDWWHAHRVRTVAKKIHDVEGGDWTVIELAALLHDVGDRKVIGKEDDDHSIAETFLRSLDLDNETAERVMFIIKNISYSKSIDAGDFNKPIELQIVQDADRFDAIGAIGIARAFAFGGSRGRPLYDPDQSAQVYATTAEYKAGGGSTLHHFDEKLFLLRGMLNTQTAKDIAKERDTFMHDFYDRFLKEWNAAD